jgi:inosose dehydratase
MNKTSRRRFLENTGVALAALPISRLTRFSPELKNVSGTTPGAEAGRFQQSHPEMILSLDRFGFKLGLASYTFRAFSLDEALVMTKRLGLKKICLKSMHLPLESREDQIAAAVQKVRNAGIELYAGGVIYMTNEREVSQAFEYARAAGMAIIVGAPHPELLKLAENYTQKYKISLAIHNHGPTDKLFPTPESVYEKIKGLDWRIGLCLDVGHTQRCGTNPADSVARCFDRLLDIHMKDVSASNERGETLEIGRGVVDVPQFLRRLVKRNYRGTVSLEYEKDEKDPLPGAAESIGFVKGVLAAL